MKLTFRIEGQSHQVDLNEELRIDNLDADRSEVAAKIAYWGAVLAAGEEAVEKLEASFDHWNGKAVDACVTQDDKPSEWKVKAAVQAQDDFLKQKHALAAARSQAAKIRAVYNGYTRKHDLLRAMTGREGPERGSANDLGRTPAGGTDPRLDRFRQSRTTPNMEG